MEYKLDCHFFTGYKPCKFKRSCQDCPHYKRPEKRIALLSLEAMGAVLRSTSLLPAIKRKFSNCHITWITLPMCKSLLDNNPMIDRLICLDEKSSILIHHLKFDILYAVDKSLEAGAIAETIQAQEKFGFGLTEMGSIRPLSVHAQYQYDVGLDDQLKFFTNQQPETQQTTESMNLPWQRDSYILNLSAEETREVQSRRDKLLHSGAKKAKGVIGYNTGCSLLYPYKKFTVERAIETIQMWRLSFPEYIVTLLGGREDQDRQIAMKQAFANDPMVVSTPTNSGLRSGILWVDTSDVVFSGCSLGMHIAIGLKKPVIAWFGVSCSQEVDLYDNGIKLQAEVSCSPCWKKTCSNEPKCYNQVHPEKIKLATSQLLSQII